MALDGLGVDTACSGHAQHVIGSCGRCAPPSSTRPAASREGSSCFGPADNEQPKLAVDQHKKLTGKFCGAFKSTYFDYKAAGYAAWVPNLDELIARINEGLGDDAPVLGAGTRSHT